MPSWRGRSSAPFEWNQRVVGCLSDFFLDRGCLAPEYICTDRVLSTKCDVFSFGVLVQRKWLEGAYSRNNVELEMTKRFIMVGLFCIQIDATHRPGMEEVVAMLTGNSYPDALLSEIQAMN
ncbi:kinase RLK-Pelle-DLSV family protein [Tanacetum coccineum]